MAKLNRLPPRVASLDAPKHGWKATSSASTTARGYGWAWQKQRERILKRDAGLCQPCLRRGHVTPDCRTVDHITPKARGGGDEEENLQTICDGPDSCHQAKTQAESRGMVWDESLPVVIGLDGWPSR